jgi:hypothetical protein
VRITRKTLQLGLAVLWLLDGALQCQRFMFTRAFAQTALAPAGDGQPAFVAHTVHWASNIVVAHPVLTNTGFAAIQLGIGFGLCFRRSVRWALAVSVIWGLGVWWLGEGIGGLTTGETLLTGAPGAALLYSVIAVLAWPSRDGDSASPPSRWAIPAWVTLWISGAGLQIAAGNNTGSSFAMMLRDVAPDNGGWIGAVDRHLSQLHISNGFVALLIALEILIALWALIPGRARQLSVISGCLIAASAWVIVQGLGDLTSGQATDPNSGPLILLLAVSVLGARVAPPENRTHASTTPQRELVGTSTETTDQRPAVV